MQYFTTRKPVAYCSELGKTYLSTVFKSLKSIPFYKSKGGTQDNKLVYLGDSWYLNLVLSNECDRRNEAQITIIHMRSKQHANR